MSSLPFTLRFTAVAARRRLAWQLRQLACLKGHAWLLAMPAIIGAAVVLAVWSSTYLKQEKTYRSLQARYAADAVSMANAYAQNATRAIEQVDQFSMFVKFEWERGANPLSLKHFLGSNFFPNAPRHDVFITDAEGTPVSADMASHKGMLVNTEYFQYHKNHRDPNLRISAPVLRRYSGRMGIHFTRRLEKADGTFDGIVQVVLPPAYFTAVYDKAGMGQAGMHALIGTDGAPRWAGVGGKALTVPAQIASGPVPVRAPDSAEADEKVERWFSDGKPRFVGRSAISKYPFVAVAGLAREDMQARYRESHNLYCNLAWLSTAVVLLLTLASTAVIGKSLWNRRQKEEERNTYRVATDGANEGFAIFRAVRDVDNSVVDFKIVDCNDRGAMYLGTQREEALGRRFSSFYDGAHDYFHTVMGQLRHAMEVGFYEDEYKLPPESPVKVGWLNRRFVRSGDGLALTLRDITGSKAHEQQLARIANEDPLTGLPNRHALIQFLPQALQRAHDQHHQLALFFIDLDNFKNVNDTLGHAAGDALLTAVAHRLKSVLRGSDFIARQGGDEFTVILEQVGSQADCEQVAEKMIAALEEPLNLFGTINAVGASIGISMYPKDGMTADMLLRNSDIAMYHAKFAGKGHYCFYLPSLSESLEVRINSERALQQALIEDQFALVYQPRVSTETGELLSLEALVRWIHPERGLVPPLDFIPLAEETGQIVQLGELVLDKACAQIARWRQDGLPVVPVSINVSPRQFTDCSLLTSFADALKRHALGAELVEIEVTESSMMGTDTDIAQILTELRALGLKLLVDDFGTGYSSLSQLLRLEMDVLKVDRSFTSELGRTPEGAIFFKAIVSMAHALGMSVVAEGVETELQLKLLHELECDEVQGYLISRPLPPEQIPALLQQRFLLEQMFDAPRLALA
ncbi:MAG TPA: EAL domain-containing protein [Burkholderiaceae bacterium]